MQAAAQPAFSFAGYIQLRSCIAKCSLLLLQQVMCSLFYIAALFAAQQYNVQLLRCAAP